MTDIFAIDADLDVFAAQIEDDIFRYSAAVTGGHRWQQEHEVSKRKAALEAGPEAPKLPPAVEAIATRTEGLKPEGAGLKVPEHVPESSAAENIAPAPAEEPPAVQEPAKPKPPKPKKPEKAIHAPPELSKQNPLGFHQSAIKKALETWQNPSGRGTREQLLKHLAGQKGAQEEAKLVELGDFLKDKPNVNRQDVVDWVDKHLHTHSTSQMHEHENEGKETWTVYDDNGNTHGTGYESEEEAQQAADDANNSASDDLENEFNIEGEDPHQRIDTSHLENLEEGERELGGAYGMAESRALHKLGNMEFSDPEEAADAVKDYIKRHLPKTFATLDSDSLNNLVIDAINDHPGGWTVESPLSSDRHSRHFQDTYDSEDEAWEAVSDYIDNHFESPYMVSQDEESGDQTHFERYTQKGPRENYTEMHIAMPGIRGDNWEDGHSEFENIENPVIRLRHDDREAGPEGLNTFFIDEIQGPADDEQEKMPKWLQGRMYDIGLKRAMTKAVQGGYDAFGWTVGEEQAKRYNLQNEVDRIEWRPAEPDFSGDKYGFLVGIKNGKEKVNKHLQEKDLPNYIGKELTEKMMANKEERPKARIVYNEDFKKFQIVDPYGKEIVHRDFHDEEEAKRTLQEIGEGPPVAIHSAEGSDLAIGGRGLKQLYDRDLHKRLMDIKIGGESLKSLGVKIEPSEVPNGMWEIIQDGALVKELSSNQQAKEMARTAGVDATVVKGMDPIWLVNITPQLRDAIKKHGVTLYKKQGEPERYGSRDQGLMAIIRKMPASEAVVYAAGVLSLIALRPLLLKQYSTEELSYLRGLVAQFG